MNQKEEDSDAPATYDGRNVMLEHDRCNERSIVK